MLVVSEGHSTQSPLAVRTETTRKELQSIYIASLVQNVALFLVMSQNPRLFNKFPMLK